SEMVAGFIKALRAVGYDRPRIKILPPLRLGAEVQRCRGYSADEFVTKEMMDGFDQSTLLCSHSRIVTDRGVHVCPILIEATDSRLGSNLAEAHRDFPLRYGACFTCYQYGSICSNPSGGLHDA